MQHVLGSRPGTRTRLATRSRSTRRTARPLARRATPTLLPAPVAWVLAVARIRLIQEVVVVGVAAFLYFFVRGLMHGQEPRAFANADRLIDVERALGIFWEPSLQVWALRYDWIGTVANWVYIWGHWPVIISTLVWLLLKHREQYSVFRNALLISGGIGLVCFTLFPLAPPRFMVDWGFVDTVTLHSNSYRVMQPPSLVNQYAAMPSLHAGWDLLMGIALVTYASHRLVRLVGYLLPVLMVLAIVLTANHYLMDAVVGSLVALTGLFAARRLSTFRRLNRPETSPLALPQGQVALSAGD